MSEWKEYKLGELTLDGKGHYGIAAPAVDFDCSKYTYLRITDINDDGTINRQGLKSVDDVKAKEYLLKPNDIVFARTGASVGRSYFYDGKDGELVYAGFLIKFSLNPEKVCPYILKAYTHSQEYYDWIRAVDNGATRGNINAQTFASMPISLPSLDEQKRIAGVLSSLDDKIDLLNRENATLEALAETLFRHYFIENPDPTWKEGTIADLIEFNPNRKLAKNEDSPYVEMANIKTQGYAPSSWRMRPFAGGTKYINGDAIMARISPCLENGKAAYIDFLEEKQVGWGSTEFIVMRSKIGLHPFFAYIMTRYDDFRDHAVSSLVGSSGRQRVDLDNLLKYSMLIPDEKAIASFYREMEMIVPKMRNNQLQIQTLATQRDTLLPRLMSGEVKVGEQ